MTDGARDFQLTISERRRGESEGVECCGEDDGAEVEVGLHGVCCGPDEGEGIGGAAKEGLSAASDCAHWAHFHCGSLLVDTT